MNPVVVLGCTTIGGLLAGYLMGRRALQWSFVAIFAICACGLGIVSILPSMQVDRGIGLTDAMFWNAAIVVFAACVFVAGIIGLVARRVFDGRGNQ